MQTQDSTLAIGTPVVVYATLGIPMRGTIIRTRRFGNFPVRYVVAIHGGPLSSFTAGPMVVTTRDLVPA